MDKDSKALIARIQRYTTQDIDELMEDCVHSIERLNAENERLREALEEIANAPVPDTRFNGRGYVPDFDGFKPIARTALAGQEEKGL